MTRINLDAFGQCDPCGRMTDRLHHGFTCGLEYAACDACYGYDHAAYGEPPARYLDEIPDPEEEERWQREYAARDMPEREP
jgi:hypothetical protein